MVVRVTRNIRIENQFITEQNTFTSTRLSIPSTTTEAQNYHIQYGRQLDFAGAGGLTTLLRVPAGNWTAVSLDALVSGVPTGDVTLKVDVGNDGTWDWEETQAVTNAATFSNDQLAAAFAPYVTGSGEVDVPIKVYLSQPGQLLLTNFVIEREQAVDLTPTFAVDGTPTEGATVALNAAVTNDGEVESGPLTVSYYATRRQAQGDAHNRSTYIGSTFISNIPAGESVPAPFEWNTFGFTGPVTVTAAVDPFNRLGEVDEENNRASGQLTIRTRPDLKIADVTFSSEEPLAGETVEISVDWQNGGETATGTHTVALYEGNPAVGGQLVQQTEIATFAAQANRRTTFTWTPTAPGPYRLFLQTDGANQVSEFDESNNAQWLDLYVSMASPLAVDSGTAGDETYSAGQGFGLIDSGLPDEVGNCGSAPHETYRRDPSGAVTYRFDHLAPNHFYHLDLTLYECGQSVGRQQRVQVDGIEIAGPIDLGSGNVEERSLLLDPALYADRSISVTVSVDGTGGALVNQIALVDVDYRYADAGGALDAQYPSGLRPYGWLDGVRQSSWGTLPYQSLRENQTGNEVRYRFDALAADKTYQIHLSFYQGSGANRVQQIHVDNIPLSGDFTIVAGQRNTQRVVLPKESYADGTVTVAVRRSGGATAGAMLNEIALEEITQQQAPSCQVTGTPAYTIAYGDLTIDGQPAPGGTMVTAENPRGDVVGCFVVTSAGKYGFVSLYGEDTSGTPTIPGMQPGEPVIFRVNGVVAVPTPLLSWQDDKTRHKIDLAAGVTEDQYFLLDSTWNLISTRMKPPVPLLSTVFQSIAEKYCLVLGQRGIHDCTVPANFRSLKAIEAGKGYYIKVEGGASVNLVIEGVTVAPDTPLPLEQGLNWVGYLPTEKLPIATALESIAEHVVQVADGQGRIYDPTEPDFSTLAEMVPGDGYLIHVSNAVTLTYPTTSAIETTGSSVVSPSEESETNACADVAPTPHFTALYGTLTLDGVAVAVGDRVEAITPRGEVAGCFTVTTAGQYGFMTLFGSDGDDTLPAFQSGEAIQLRLNGTPLSLPETVRWQDDKATYRFDLGVAGSAENKIYLPDTRR